MAVIFICHIFLWVAGNEAVDIDWYVQIAPLPYLKENPFQAIWYLHGCPPGLSIIWYLTYLFGSWQYGVLHLITIGLHLISYYWINTVIKKIFQNRVYDWVLFFLMLNPLWFIYFKYPFYSTFLFSIVSAWLYVHYCQADKSKQLIQVALLLSLACLFRSSWHLVMVLLFTLWYIPKTNTKAKVIAICFLFVPFSVYLKNYVVFGTFSGTTWSAMNWANGNHIPCKEGVAAIAPFSPVSKYQNTLQGLSEHSDSYPNIPQLHEGNVHDIRIIQVGKAYRKKLDSCFSISHSVKQWFKEGIWYYLESPSEYSFLYKGNHQGKVSTGIISTQFIVADYFNLPNWVIKGSSGKPIVVHLSLYTVGYPLIMLVLLWNFKKVGKGDWIFILVLLFFSGAYSFIDYVESNRMRVEIEPLWYLFGFKAFSLLCKLRSKKMQKNIA